MVEQGMQERFDQEGRFIEKEGRIIVRGRREGRMFILDSHEMKSAMFAKSMKADSDIELWHKRIGHINLNKLFLASPPHTTPARLNGSPFLDKKSPSPSLISLSLSSPLCGCVFVVFVSAW